MKYLFKRTDQTGDTIVEVLIVLAILGFALGISFATANRSLLNIRQAQENSSATETAQTQIEQLRGLDNLSSTDPNYIFNTSYETAAFCINANGSGNVATPVPGTPSDPCFVNPIYSVAITYAPADTTNPGGGGTFKIVVTWPDVAGEGSDTDTILYQLYNANQPAPPQAFVPAPANVSWYNNGFEGTCTNPALCSPGPNSISGLPSVRILGNTSVHYNYEVQPTTPPGETVPMPGETGLTLKICYKPNPAYVYHVGLSIGGTSFGNIALPDNGIPDTSNKCSLPNNFVSVSIYTPFGSNYSLILSSNNAPNVLQIYDVTIY